MFSKYYASSNMLTYDPYDIWKTDIGIRVKNLFNSNRFLGAAPALFLTLFDLLINNKLRLGYKKQEFSIVRAFAAQTLLNDYHRTNDNDLLLLIEEHLVWLEDNKSKGYSGASWGLGFKWAAFKNVIYEANTPHTTHTPYALEAFHNYTQFTNDQKYHELIKSCYKYYEKDVQIMFDNGSMIAVSYGPFNDKIVTNASSYTLFAYSIFLDYFPEDRDYILNKMMKLYRFIVEHQQKNGSWFYSPYNKNSFIDCFHSCIILKNMLKANEKVEIEGLKKVVENGYNYVTKNFYCSKYGLFKRFTKNNKVSLTKFDLYDNAEVLNLANMMGDTMLVNELKEAISKHFIKVENIYSVIDFMGIKRNKNTLRWAVMPYLFALSSIK